MTNQIALWMGVVLIVAIGADVLANDGSAVIFLIRKFMELLDWVVFWR